MTTSRNRSFGRSELFYVSLQGVNIKTRCSPVNIVQKKRSTAGLTHPHKERQIQQLRRVLQGLELLLENATNPDGL